MGGRRMGEVAQRAEALGSRVSASPITRSLLQGRESDGVSAVWPDWSVLSTYLALRTTPVRIVACVVIPYRPVLSMAKQIATLDVVSNGRFTFAAATGWLKPEFEMLGVNHRERGSITDEYLRAMKILWTEDAPAFQGAMSP